MALCDRILPPGLHSDINYNGVIAIRSVRSVEVPSLDELKERLCLANSGWTMYAGFITEPHCPGNRVWAGWTLCERAATADVKEKRKAWRIVFTPLGDGHPYTYDSVEEFLKWYAGYEVREYNSWDYENKVYLDEEGNPIADD